MTTQLKPEETPLEEVLRQKAEEEASLAATWVRPADPLSQTVSERGPGGAQRRSAPRVALCTEISLHSDSNFFTGFTNDVSEGGVFVATVNLLPVGAHVDVSFSLPQGQSIEARGEVRWVREFDDKNPGVFPGMGIRFVDVPLPALGAIHTFTRQRDPMFFPES